MSTIIKNYEDRIVCFIDILGFKNHIRDSDTDGSAGLDKISKIIDAINIIRETPNSPELNSKNTEQRKEVTQFSDCVVISFPVTSAGGVFDVLLEIMWVQINLVRKGFLCRGGIACGKLIHNSQLLFGPALLAVYELETKAAVYPRVIVDESIIDSGIKAHSQHHLPEHENSNIMSLLTKDFDGMCYIDYIARAQSELDDPDIYYPEYLYQLSEIISNDIGAKDPSVALKYGWLKEKFATHLSMVKKAARQTEDDF